MQSNLLIRKKLSLPRIRAAAIVINNDGLLVIHRKRDGKEYWVLPGGGVDEGENSEKAAVREVKEEANLDVAVTRLIYCHHLTNAQGVNSRQDYFLCKFIGGELGLRSDSIEMELMATSNQLYEPLWIPLAEINGLLLYPLEIRDWLLEDLKNGFPTQPRVAHLRIEDMRQTL